MSDPVSIRRELRRRKILENAEARKRKIFGLNKSGSNVDETLNGREELTECGSSTESEIFSAHTNSQRFDSVNAEPEISSNHHGPSTINGNDLRFPSLPERLRNRQDSYSVDEGPNFISEAADDVNSSESIFDHPLAPLVLGFFVCLMLYINLGYIVSYSIVVPFLIYEIHRFISFYNQLRRPKSEGNLLCAALILCGIPQHTVLRYINCMSILKQVVEDFGMYMFSVVMWELTFGFIREDALHFESAQVVADTVEEVNSNSLAGN